jgi:hypothetical protein
MPIAAAISMSGHTTSSGGLLSKNYSLPFAGCLVLRTKKAADLQDENLRLIRAKAAPAENRY